ncbi:hypothetical protein FPOAC2_10498 [Fusarium poae]|uniref:RING-type domain-containing protein n=1 Tax=Fusarium poae TaxID=36050 RepID=A0A1B8AB73_FUSPO|nr:hypothetical protein FPOAC1_010222 [Fusarium poae]KAG8665426.1 hypothetical protein FPOAC1_010222 [Fusarium poae]OBS17727.1 hypothetical protein FPOA_09459 [Fusarium poae]
MTSTNNPPLISVTADTGETTFCSITNTFWPSFRKAVENDEANIRPYALKCGLCTELMLTQPSQDRYYRHCPWILPCGHMLGYSCLQDMAGDIWGFFDKNKNLACPACNADVPVHGCGCKAMGMRAPLVKEFFSTVPPIRSECGLTATACGICEGKSALQKLRSDAALDPPILERGQRMNLSIRVEPSSLGIVYQDDHYRLVNPCDNQALNQKTMKGGEVPEIVRDRWETFTKAWSEQAQWLWFFPNSGFFTLCASIEEKKRKRCHSGRN